MSAFKTPAGRLTEAGVRAMRRMRDEKEDGQPRYSYQFLAGHFGVSMSTVFNVCTNRTWSWLK